MVQQCQAEQFCGSRQHEIDWSRAPVLASVSKLALDFPGAGERAVMYWYPAERAPQIRNQAIPVFR